jgi:hypothetical protein
MALELTEHDAVDAAPQAEKVEKLVEKPVEKQVEKPVENPNHALFVEKTIEWANLITKKADLADIWKKNQEDINNLKKESPELYEKLKERFGELKSNLKD